MNTPLVLIYALKEEIRFLLQDFRKDASAVFSSPHLQKGSLYGVPVVLCRTGVGMGRAHEGTERLLKEVTPDLVLSIGCAGGVDPALKTGDLTLPTEVVTETPTDHFKPDPLWTERIKETLRTMQTPFSEGVWMTSWGIVTKDIKRNLGSQGILAVDMETASIMAILKKRRIPFAAIRTIYDTAEDELPFTEPIGDENPALFVLKNPKMLLKIPKFFRMNQTCQKAMRAFMKHFLKNT